MKRTSYNYGEITHSGFWVKVWSVFQTTRHGNLEGNFMTHHSSGGVPFRIDGRDGSNIFFHYSSLKDFLPMFNEGVNTFLEKLRPLADGKTEVPMKEAFHEVALDVISKVRYISCHYQFGIYYPKYTCKN